MKKRAQRDMKKSMLLAISVLASLLPPRVLSVTGLKALSFTQTPVTATPLKLTLRHNAQTAHRFRMMLRVLLPVTDSHNLNPKSST